MERVQVQRRRHRLTWGAVSRGELESVEGARTTARAALCVWAGPKGCRRGLGLRLPSESLLWLLGGVGGRCRWSTEAGGKEADFIHQTAAKQGLGMSKRLSIQHSRTGDSWTEKRGGSSS